MEHSFDKDYWDQIWQGQRAAAMGTSQTNPHLIEEIGDLQPGTALDAGCGAGAEAIWLAEQGWQVTAADVAAEALAYGAARAADCGVADRVQWVQADLSVWEPATRYDLVTTHYAHPAIPQLAFYDRIASWVAPAGTLFIVGHLHHHDPSSAANQGHNHGNVETDEIEPPASASMTAPDITARLDPAIWDVATVEESSRTMTGSSGHAISIHDVVVRATRR